MRKPSTLKPRRLQLILEALEHRYAPACELSFSGGELRIIGDFRDNTVELSDNGAGAVTATCDGSTATFMNVNAVEIDLRAGNDRVQHSFTGPATRAMDYDAHMGRGDDVFISQTTLGFRAETSMFVDCHEGADRVHILWSGTVDTPSLVDAVSVSVHGGDLADITGLNDDDFITITAELDAVRGNLSFQIIGAAGDDETELVYDGELDTLLDCSVLGMQGVDDASMGIFLQPGSSGNVNALMDGGSGGDELFFRVRKNGIKDSVTINAELKGGLGNDTAYYSAAFVDLLDNIETTFEL